MPIDPRNKARYPADWKVRSHFVRFVRADGKCEWCEAPHGYIVWRQDGNARAWIGFDAEHEYRIAHGPEYDHDRNDTIDLCRTMGAKVVLTCAHVFDHRPEKADLLNLAALCQLCHNRHDAKHRARNRANRSRRGRTIADLFDDP